MSKPTYDFNEHIPGNNFIFLIVKQDMNIIELSLLDSYSLTSQAIVGHIHAAEYPKPKCGCGMFLQTKILNMTIDKMEIKEQENAIRFVLSNEELVDPLEIIFFTGEDYKSTEEATGYRTTKMLIKLRTANTLSFLQNIVKLYQENTDPEKKLLVSIK